MSAIEQTVVAGKERHPAIDLVARYVAVFRAAWTLRGQLAGPALHADERAFLPAVLSLQATPVHPAPRRAMAVIMALFVVALAWSIVGQVDIVAVAPGRIVVSENTKVIQPLEVSNVRAILVHDGERVRRGQVLVELDPTAARADSTSVRDQLRDASNEAERSHALLAALVGKGTPAHGSTTESEALIQIGWSDIAARLRKLDAESDHREAEIDTARAMLSKLETTLPMARQREADFKSLTDQGYVASHAGQDRTRERVEMEHDQATQQARLREALAGLRESRDARDAYVAETRRDLSDHETEARHKVAQLQQQAVKSDQKERLTSLAAPVDGTVQELAVHTAGGVVTAAQKLMVIVPDEAEVTAEVVVDNKDIGFVRQGQHAEIKLETFNFTHYGTVPATVSLVTADAVNDEKRGAIFPATLKLSTSAIDVDGKRIRLGPGMNVTAEIKTGRRRVIDYLLSPVQESLSGSLKER